MKKDKKDSTSYVLNGFQAVTITSLYHAAIYGSKGVPVLTKLAQRNGCESKVAVGSRLTQGTMLGVAQKIVLFVPEGGGITSYQREFLLVNTRYWGEHTSDVVGLFLRKEDAERCMTTNDVKPCDERWRKETVETLKAIGRDHPYCSISTVTSADSIFNPLIVEN